MARVVCHMTVFVFPKKVFTIALRMVDLEQDIEFFRSTDKLGPIKATIQKSGRLGFSSGAIQLMRLDESKLFKVGRLKTGLRAELGPDPSEQDLLLIPSDREDSQTFRACKAGNYYYLKTRTIMGILGIDYKNERGIIFDIDELKNGARVYYRLTRKKRGPNTT
jgi:hypothetical protein